MLTHLYIMCKLSMIDLYTIVWGKVNNNGGLRHNPGDIDSYDADIYCAVFCELNPLPS